MQMQHPALNTRPGRAADARQSRSSTRLGSTSVGQGCVRAEDLTRTFKNAA